LRRRKTDIAGEVRTLSMGEVAPSIAHEVNQPLAALLTNAEAGLQWLSGETPNVQQARASLAMIVQDGRRASAIVRSIHELLNKERGEMVSLDMNQIIEDAVAPMRADFLKRRISLRIERSAALPPVRGDQIQLQQVIFNLVKNGTGIHPEDVERIFQPFFTTKDAGMGIGLSISESIIEAHGGRIWAERNEGPGLTVQFSVPAATPNAAPSKALRRKPPGAVNRTRHQSISRTH
jgi:signal transduction histidine kinase